MKSKMILSQLKQKSLCVAIGLCLSLGAHASVVVVNGVSQTVPDYPLGLVSDSAELIGSKMLSSASLDQSTPLPPVVDLTNLLPTPGDQWPLPSCTSWAVGYAAKTYSERVEEGWSIATPFHQFSPSWIYNQMNGGVAQGTSIAGSMELIVNKGADTLSSFPRLQTDVTKQPDASSLERASHFKARSYSTLSVDTFTFKSMLAGGNPIVVPIQVLPDFDALNNTDNKVYDTAAGTRPPSCMTAPCSRGGHAITIIGYDDSTQRFKFINSWGTSRSAGGYGWIPYSFITNPNLGMSAGYVLNDKANTPIKEFRTSFKGTGPWTGTALKTNPGGANLPDLTINDVLVGDFDGDGHQDLFTAQGTGFFISSSAYKPWKKISNSGTDVHAMVTGDFNGDHVSDILYANGSEWWIKWSGIGSWDVVRSSTATADQLLVADFDGDGKDDVFRASGGHFNISWAAQSAWEITANSNVASENLKVGEFDGQRGADILYVNGSSWRILSGARGSWTEIGTSSITADKVLVGDFNGDGRSDVLGTWGGEWKVSYSGTSNWTLLGTSGKVASQLQVGHFGDGPGCDLITD